ncbi:MAG: CHRD domain-containing protein [Elainellaceae cyanobacterium]
MSTQKKQLKNLALAICTCLLAISLYSPAFGKMIALLPIHDARLQTSQLAMVERSLGEDLDTTLKAATSTLLAQGMSNDSIVPYVAVMSKQNVVPNAPTTSAFGAVGAVLAGDRLIVRGSFSNLTSPMRDYATDPVDPPNSNITSAFHLHQGDSSMNGPFQYALNVMLDETERGGSVAGEYTLSADQLQALSEGLLYVDLHTTRNRGGELRGILMPSA